MKRFSKAIAPILLCTFIITAIPYESKSYENDLGVGIIIGDPTGLSFAWRVQSSRAFTGGLAWSLRDDTSIHAHVDYLFYHHDIIPVEIGTLPLYYGIGGRLRFGDTDKLGVRLPLGVAYQFEQEPIELFFEIVPILELVPGTELTGNVGIGIRYYF